MGIENLFHGALKRNERGYWETQGSEPISYTKNGHDIILNYEDNSFWYKHRNECIKSLLKTNKVLNILDVGGGNGYVSHMIQQMGVRVTLLEPGTSGVLNALNRGVIEVIKGTPKTLGMRVGSFEAIGLFDVLEHIENEDEFLQSLNCGLKNQGKLFITVPAHQYLWSNFDVEVGHFRRYNLLSLVSKLEENGFYVIYKSYFFSLLLIPLYMLRKVFKINKSRMNRKKEHIGASNIIGRLVGVVLIFEKWFISRQIKLPFGTSCIVVAVKK